MNFGKFKKISAPDNHYIIINFRTYEVIFYFLVDYLNLLFEKVDFREVMFNFRDAIILDVNLVDCVV